MLSLSACAGPLPTKGTLGYSEERKVVIVGENVDKAIAAYYQKKYDALVWFTSYQGEVGNFANNVVESGLGPSKPMRALINQLLSINQTIGRWEIYIPKIAEKYFLITLKHMERGSLAKARGAIILLDAAYAPEVQREVHRVTQGSFFVEFETEK